MWRFDWHDRSYLTLCGDAQRLQNIAKEAIFPLLTEASTPEQFDEALASLERVKEKLIKNKKTFHFSATAGRHYCIEECFADLVETLKTKWQLLPKPQPSPEPRSPLETPEQVIADLNELIQHRPDETVLGEDTFPENNR
jgi:hypothetical protein